MTTFNFLIHNAQQVNYKHMHYYQLINFYTKKYFVKKNTKN